VPRLIHAPSKDQPLAAARRSLWRAAEAVAGGLAPGVGAPAATESRPAVRERAARGEYVFKALLTLAAFTAIPYGTVAPWWEAFFECAVFALGICWLLGALRRDETLNLGDGGALVWPCLALIAFAVAQTLPVWPALTGAGGAAATAIREGAAATARVLSAAPFETWRFALKLLALVVAGVLLRACVAGNERRFRALVHLVIYVGAASALFALVRQAFQREGFFVLPLLQPGTGFGQFVNHNHFALLMEMSWGLAFGLALGKGLSRRARLAYVLAGLLLWTALVLSDSRGGIFSMLGQFCLFAALWPHLLLKGAWRSSVERRENEAAHEAWRGRLPKSFALHAGQLACLLVVIVLGVSWVGGDSLANRIDLLPREVQGGEGLSGEADPRLRARRAEMWAATWQVIKANPVAGVGFGGFEPAVTEFYDASGNWTLQQAHNDYLELLASGGVIAALIAIWFVFALVRAARRQLHAASAFRRAACRGALVGLCGVALHSLVDFGLHITVNALVCVALIVIATVGVDGEDGGRAPAEA
jgi:O-antigen ligase